MANLYEEDPRPVIQCNIRDIAEREQLEEELHQLSGHLLHLQDGERRRICREPHNSTAPELAAVAMNLGLVQQGIAGRDLVADNQLADSQAILERCQRELRTLTNLLHPPVLEKRPDWEVCGEAVNEREAVDLAKALRPDVIMLDITMAELNGLEATRQICKAIPKAEVVILTMRDSERMASELLAADARGYILRALCGRN